MPITTVAALIQNEENLNEILLTRRDIPPFKDRWCLPGGHIDKYESVLKAVIREVKEEVGLDFKPRFFGYFDEIIPDLKIHAVVIAFWSVGKGTPEASKSEVREMDWFSCSEALSFDLAFQHKEIISEFVRYKKLDHK